MEIKDRFGFFAGLGAIPTCLTTAASSLTALFNSSAAAVSHPVLITAAIASLALLLASSALALKSAAWSGKRVVALPKLA